MITLRPYQLSAIQRLRESFRKGLRRLVLVSPTGSGKTVQFSFMITEAITKGYRAIVLVHRGELIDQTLDKLSSFGVPAGVIMATDKRRDDYLPIQLCSVQTLARRLNRLPQADLVIVDECHHALSPTWQRVLEAYPNAFIIGATATPWRTDRRGLSDLFDGHVVAATPAELITQGHLVEYDCFAYDAPDLHKVKVTAGEFNFKDLGLACNTKILVGSVVREYVQHAANRRAIIFPVNIEHSQHLVTEFSRAGFLAAHVDYHTPKEERKSTMERFRSGDLQILSSCGVLTEGFDAPAAEVCILARPTKSLTLYLQMVGRVLRPSPETGKQRALIHDHAGNTLRHGFLDDDRDYSLKATPERVRALFTCPACYQIFGAIKNGRCPNCNALIAVPDERSTSGGRSDHEVVEGKRISRAEIEKIRNRRKDLGIQRELSNYQLAKAAAATRQEKVAEYLRLKKLAEEKGFQKGFVWHQFRAVFSHAPKFSDAELTNGTPALRPFIPLPPRTGDFGVNKQLTLTIEEANE